RGPLYSGGGAPIIAASVVRAVLPCPPLARGLTVLKRHMMANLPIYKVIFHNQHQVYELYARHVYASDMYGFIEVEAYLFGERAQMIVDPGEEKLKTEFNGVKRSWI